MFDKGYVPQKKKRGDRRYGGEQKGEEKVGRVEGVSFGEEGVAANENVNSRRLPFRFEDLS